jgi:hypothetical protein
MVKVIFLFRFRADRDPEDVRNWWLNEHSVIARRTAVHDHRPLADLVVPDAAGLR